MHTPRPRALLPLSRALAGTLVGTLLATSVPPLHAQAAKGAGKNAASATAAAAAGAPRFRGEPVTLNFVNAEIEGVSRAMSAILRQPILVDPRVKGQITLYSEKAVRPDEAYVNYLAALRGLGFTVVEVGGLLKVVPEADAKLQTGTVSVGTGPVRRGDQVLTQIFKLTHENANNLVPVLRPLISPNNTINATAGANALVITDYADNLERLGRIIAAMDTPTSGDVEVIVLEHAVASDIAPLVQRAGDSSAAAGVPGAVGTGSLQVLVDSRSNSLLIKAPTPARMASVRALVRQLDRPLAGAAGQGNIWVVHLRNADAAKLATVLRAAFGAGGGGGSQGGGGTNSPTAGLGNQPGIGNVPGSPTNTAATSPVGASPSPSTGGFIQADPSTNSLIITGPEPLYRQVRAMIDQLDSRRAQVYIESMIVEVSGNNDADFGFQWQGLIGKAGDNAGIVIGTNSSIGGPSIISLAQTAAGVAGGGLPGAGLNIGLVQKVAGAYTLGAIARILQSQTNTNIISTPNLVSLDNEEAKIIVGSNVPFITGQFTNTGTGTGATSPFQTIERKDVGITLRIRPQVGEGGAVRMTLFQESSSLSTETAPGTSNAGPSTNKRSIESTVMVDDGQILVLGGLIEDRYTDNKSKVPLLGDIPYVGALFRSESRSKKRTNLMVFLRPIVMRDGMSTDRLSIDRYEQIRAFQKDGQPVQTPLIPISESPVLPPMAPPPGTAPARVGGLPAAMSPPANEASAPRRVGRDR